MAVAAGKKGREESILFGRMASSQSRSQARSSSASDGFLGDTVTYTQRLHFVASAASTTTTTTAAAAGAGVASAPPAAKEESLYEALLRYHQQEATTDDSEFDDDSEERMYRRTRQRDQPTSGLRAVTEEEYLRQQIERQPQYLQQHLAMEDDCKIPPYESSQEDLKPSARTHRSDEGERRARSPRRNTSASSYPYRSNSPLRDNDVTLLTPSKANKPGIFHVNEPAIRSNSAMYMDAYGDEEDESKGPATTQGAPMIYDAHIVAGSSSIASMASEEPRVVGASPHLANDTLSGYGIRLHTRDTAAPTAPHQSLPPPMGPDELRSTLEILKQTKKTQPSREDNSATLSFHTYKRQNKPSDRGRMDANNIRQTLQNLQQTKNPVSNSAAVYPPVYTRSTGGSLYPTRFSSNSVNDTDWKTSAPASIHAFALSPRKMPLPMPRDDEFTREPIERLRQGSKLQNHAKPKVTSIPRDSRRRSGTNVSKLNPMDFGSDEHIRSTREMERRKSGDLYSIQRRGVSPSHSVGTSASGLNPESGFATMMGPSSRRSSGYDNQSFESGQSGERKHASSAPMVKLKVTPPNAFHLKNDPAAQYDPSHSRASNSLREATRRDQSADLFHNDKHVGRFAANSVHRHEMKSADDTGETPPLLIGKAPGMLRSERMMQSNNYNTYHGQYIGASELDAHCANDQHPSLDSLTSNDDDLKLALELSLQEANSRAVTSQATVELVNLEGKDLNTSGSFASERSHVPSSDGSLQQNRLRVSNAYLQSLPASNSRTRVHHIEISPFGQEAYSAAKSAAESNTDELILALKLSAEESRSAELKSSFDGTVRPYLGDSSLSSRPTDIVQPSDQYRILQQIREEKERKDLELVLKVSQKEVGRPILSEGSRYKTPPTQSRVSAGCDQDVTGDFLVSQQNALEEYQRSQEADSRTSSFDHNRRNITRSTFSDVYRENLLVQGTIETQRAIASGRAQTVTCRRCSARLQAPVSYGLVYCPKCETISPA